MKKLLLLFFSLCFSITVFTQSNITISGVIIDKETNLPLPYVNIGFVKKAVGTVSDDNGKFWLTFDTNKISANDILQISSIG